MVLATRGSSEAIDLLIRAFCRAGVDNIVTSSPTFAMYRVYADIQGAQTLDAPLLAERDFAFDAAAVLDRCTPSTKLIFVCSPNNPTGGLVPQSQISELAGARRNRSLVVIDEAYAEFSGVPSAIALLHRYENLVVLRTLSKALSLAGARCGAVVASDQVISLLDGILAPYALATPVIDCVLRSLSPENLQVSSDAMQRIIRERERVSDALALCPDVLKVWPSRSNFLLVKFRSLAAVAARLRELSHSHPRLRARTRAPELRSHHDRQAGRERPAARGASPHFSYGGEMIAQRFGFTTDFWRKGIQTVFPTEKNSLWIQRSSEGSSTYEKCGLSAFAAEA